jgi:hypothetical protein
MNTARREPTDFDAWLAASPDVEPVSVDENRHGDWNHLLALPIRFPYNLK